MAFLSKELVLDKRTSKRHLDSLDCDVWVRSICGETRKVVIEASSAGDGANVDLPADAFAKVAARMCAEAILGENKEPVGDFAWWYDQPTDVLIECRLHVAEVSGLRAESVNREKKESKATTNSESFTASRVNMVAIPTNCETVTAAAN